MGDFNDFVLVIRPIKITLNFITLKTRLTETDIDLIFTVTQSVIVRD